MAGDIAPRTHIVITGIGDGIREVIEALEGALMTETELARGLRWVGKDDRFEPWLGAPFPTPPDHRRCPSRRTQS